MVSSLPEDVIPEKGRVEGGIEERTLWTIGRTGGGVVLRPRTEVWSHIREGKRVLRGGQGARGSLNRNF